MRRCLERGCYQGAGAAGDRLPLRAGDLDAGHDRQRAGGGGAARHPDQGRRVPGAGARHQGALALDKTGTITEGKPRLVTESCRWRSDAGRRRLRLAGGAGGALRSSGVDGDRLAWHGRAATCCRSRRLRRRLPGRGVQGVIDGRHATTSAITGWWTSSALHAASSKPSLAERRTKRRAGRSCCSPTRRSALAVFAVADTVQASSRAGDRRTARAGRAHR